MPSSSTDAEPIEPISCESLSESSFTVSLFDSRDESEPESSSIGTQISPPLPLSPPLPPGEARRHVPIRVFVPSEFVRTSNPLKGPFGQSNFSKATFPPSTPSSPFIPFAPLGP